jgi:UDP-N-acetylglucosamine--N-acetylmuramyl-(pentapeptide) pyrophosphoryl-undecaprenol N-acetylglucosamine transferase
MSSYNLQIIWGVGKWDFSQCREAAAKYENRIFLVDYISDMSVAYAAADLVLCRAGALTLAEISACGLPAILVPFAAAAGQHQEANAKSLAQIGAAQVILEKDLNPDFLARMIVEFIADPERLNKMHQAACRAAFVDATGQLVRSIFALQEKK